MSQSKPTEIEITRYAESYVLYGDQSKGWRAAFPASKAKPEVVHNKASQFHQIGEVQDRIKELRSKMKKQAEEEFKLSTHDLQKTLALVMQRGLQMKADKYGNKVAHALPAVVSAVGEINKMNGNYAPTRLGIGGDPDAPPVQTSDLTDQQLQEELAKYGLKPEDL